MYGSVDIVYMLACGHSVCIGLQAWYMDGSVDIVYVKVYRHSVGLSYVSISLTDYIPMSVVYLFFP